MRTAKNRIAVLKIEPEIQNEVKGRGLSKTILEKKAIETGSRAVQQQLLTHFIIFYRVIFYVKSVQWRRRYPLDKTGIYGRRDLDPNMR